METFYLNSKKTAAFILIILILLGLSIPIFNFSFLSQLHLWPLLIFILGLVFEVIYFSAHRLPGLLIPGGILITLSSLFMFEANTNWFFAEYTWSIYILAPAFGLFQFYLFGEQTKWLLSLIAILLLATSISFFNLIFGQIIFIHFSVLLPVLFVSIILAALLPNEENELPIIT